MRLSAGIFLYGFLLDALLSVAGEWIPIATLRNSITWAVLGLGLVLYVMAAFVPRLPKRWILPPVGFLVWAKVCGGFPLAFVLPGAFQAVLDWSQLILAIGFVVYHERWRHRPPALDRPRFSWRGFAALTVAGLIALPIVALVSLVNASGEYMESSSGGYVKLRPEGLLLEERQFTKGDKQVRLVSMMHIGEKNFYDRILSSLPTDGAATVLMEGVTDNQGLLKGKFSYAKIAEMLGLTSQEKSPFQEEGRRAARTPSVPSEKQQVEYRDADVDISIFNPLTLDFINAVASMLATPTLAHFLQVVNDPTSPFQQPNADQIVLNDIIVKRNAHLLSEIDRALKTSQIVIVPWGAMHLASIEASMKEQGFQEAGHVDRPIIHLWHQRSPAPAK